MQGPRRYVSADEDSGRWNGLVFREGDVVISSRSKHGTTWLQMITLLLIHQTPDLPAPLPELPPWLDRLVEPRDTVIARLTAQPHRRVIKTHTPLDGIPLDPRVTYLVAARHPARRCGLAAPPLRQQRPQSAALPRRRSARFDVDLASAAARVAGGVDRR